MIGESIPIEYDSASGKRVGLSIESVSAFYSDETLTIIGEVASWSGRSIDDYRELQAVAYGADGQVVGRAVDNWCEFGIRQSFECEMQTSPYGYRLFGVPALVRLLPAAELDGQSYEELEVGPVAVARFRENTANPGRTIEFDGRAFRSEGFEVSLKDMLQYDAYNNLEWLTDEWRDWSQHQREHGLPPDHPLHEFGVTNLDALDGESFEQLCGRYFSRQGYAVEYTPTVGDGGVDLILKRGQEYLLVQCKRHARPVGEPVLRDLYGTLVHFQATGGVVCSSAGFTPSALTWVSGKAIRLVDGPEILRGLR